MPCKLAVDRELADGLRHLSLSRSTFSPTPLPRPSCRRLPLESSSEPSTPTPLFPAFKKKNNNSGWSLTGGTHYQGFKHFRIVFCFDFSVYFSVGKWQIFNLTLKGNISLKNAQKNMKPILLALF